MTTSKRTLINRRNLIGASAASAGMMVTGAKASTRFSAPSFRSQEATKTLEVWGGVPLENGVQGVIDGFEEQNPDIKINFTRYVNDDTGNTQLDTALQGGTKIDAFFTYDVGRMAQRIQAGAAIDLTDRAQADEVLGPWLEAASDVAIFKYDDKYYSLPTTQEPNYIYFNQNHLDDHGLELPTDGWTFEEFREMAAQLTEGMTIGTFSIPDTARMKLGPDYRFTDDGTASNFGDPAFAEWLTLHLEMMDEGTSFPWVDVLSQQLQARGQHTVFLTEQTSIWPSAPWTLQHVRNTEEYPRDFKISFAPVPVPPGATEYYNGGGINNWLMMKSDTEFPDETWEFIRYWLTDGAESMLKGGKIPAVPGLDPETVANGLLGENREELFDVASFKSVLFEAPIELTTDTITNGAAEVSQIWNGLRDQCLIGEISVEECIEQATQQADEAIQRSLN